MAYRTVAVAGATGRLGPAVVRELVDAGFKVTVLSRTGAQNALASVTTTKVDYSSQDSLVKALQGHDALVSCLPNHSDQTSLIEAAITAGVKRYIPSEFGSDVAGSSKIAALPVFEPKLSIQRYLKQKGEAITWTLVVNGLFLDWAMDAGFGINFKGTTSLFDGGNTKFSSTLLADVGKSVVGILRHHGETANRAVRVQSANVTQNELLALAAKVDPSLGRAIEPISTAQMEKRINENRHEPTLVAHGCILLSIFGQGYGGDWDRSNDNDLLGIRPLTPPELERLVAQFVQ